MRENIVKLKSFEFAKDVVRCTKYLEEKKEFVMSRQLLRSGTAIGALIREAEMAESKKDFIHKMHIALKEANETMYWIELLISTDYLSKEQGQSLYDKSEELVKLLVRIVKTAKS